MSKGKQLKSIDTYRMAGSCQWCRSRIPAHPGVSSLDALTDHERGCPESDYCDDCGAHPKRSCLNSDGTRRSNYHFVRGTTQM